MNEFIKAIYKQYIALSSRIVVRMDFVVFL